MVKVNITVFKKPITGAKRICRDTDVVYDCIMALTNDNHDEAANVQGWSELAEKGEVYEGDNFIAVCN